MLALAPDAAPIQTQPGAHLHHQNPCPTQRVVPKIDFLKVPTPYATIHTREYTVAEFKGGDDDGYVVIIHTSPCYGRATEIARPRTLSQMTFSRR